jgi:hypothetical protein
MTIGTQTQQLLKKWTDAGLRQELFIADPRCAAKIIQIHLHHPIRSWDGIIRADRETKQLEALVGGTWRRARPFFEDLEKHWNEWESKKRPGEMWSCSSCGFEKRLACEWVRLPSCGQLSPGQLQRVKALSSRLISPRAKGNADCVLEICCGWNFASKNPLKSGYNGIYRSPQHPWIRLIDAKGRLYSCGFSVSRPISLFNAWQTVEGQFRSADTYEGVPLSCKTITKIAISDKQFDDFKALFEKYQREGRKFNYLNPNCTSFVTDILHRAGFPIQTSVPIPEFAFRCLPLPVQKGFHPLFIVARKIFSIVQKYLIRPSSSKGQTPSADFLGSRGKFYFCIPRKIIEWQMVQPTTRVFAKGTPVLQQY